MQNVYDCTIPLSYNAMMLQCTPFKRLNHLCIHRVKKFNITMTDLNITEDMVSDYIY